MMLRKVTLYVSILFLLIVFIPWPYFLNYIILIVMLLGAWFITIPIFIINPITSILMALYKKELTTLNKIYFVFSITLEIIVISVAAFILVNGLINGFEFHI